MDVDQLDLPRRHPTLGSTRRYTSLPPPGCDAANSPDSAGPTGTARPTDLDRPHPASPSADTVTRSRGRPRSVVDASTSTPHTETLLASWRRRQQRDGHPVGLDDPDLHEHRGVPGAPRIDQPTLRPGSSHAWISQRSVFTICATPTLAARRLGHADQGRLRTTRARPPRLHDGHLPTRHSRHGRGRRPRFRPHAVDPA